MRQNHKYSHSRPRTITHPSIHHLILSYRYDRSLQEHIPAHMGKRQEIQPGQLPSPLLSHSQLEDNLNSPVSLIMHGRWEETWRKPGQTLSVTGIQTTVLSDWGDSAIHSLPCSQRTHIQITFTTWNTKSTKLVQKVCFMLRLCLLLSPLIKSTQHSGATSLQGHTSLLCALPGRGYSLPPFFYGCVYLNIWPHSCAELAASHLCRLTQAHVWSPDNRVLVFGCVPCKQWATMLTA